MRSLRLSKAMGEHSRSCVDFLGFSHTERAVCRLNYGFSFSNSGALELNSTSLFTVTGGLANWKDAWQ